MKDFDFKSILSRIINELNVIISDKLTPKTEYEKKRQKKKIPKSDFLNNQALMKDFPFTKETYYTYSSYIDAPKRSREITDMRISSLYKVCLYTDVSADYLLGFTDTKRKDPSAERVRQDFGLSDKAMETLSIINRNKPEVKGELSSDIVNLILENQDFWQKLNARLPVYLSNLNCSRADIDVNVARYGLSRAFEELIDDLCNKLENDGLPHEELDNTGVFSS